MRALRAALYDGTLGWRLLGRPWDRVDVADEGVDPVLRSVEWLLIFGALVWAVMFVTGVMGGKDLAVHEVFTVLLVVLFRRRRRLDT